MKNRTSWFYLFLFLTMVTLPNWVYFLGSKPLQPSKVIIGQIIGSYIVLLAPFALFGKKYHLYLLFLLIVNILLLPVELGFFHLYRDRFDLVSLTVFLETNIEEAWGFISGYKIYIALTILVHIFIMIYLYKKIVFKDTRKLRLAGIFAMLLVLLLGYRSHKILHQNFLFTVYKNVITNKSPWLMFRLGFEYYKNKKDLEKYKKIHQKFKFHAKKGDNVTQLHIVVIAESSRYDHWSLNGYKRYTNPLLNQVDNLISFSNVITGAGATNWATPLMTTPATAKDFDESIKTHSFIGAFKEAGYQTYWLSNQDKFPYLLLHADEADSVIYIKDKTIDAYDEVLFPYIRDILKKNKQKNLFIVLHIMGNHWKYDERYPEKYDKFQPSIFEKFVRMDDYQYKEEIINSYDNSMLYTDFFLYRLIQMVKNTHLPATISYVSDHGENLYDTSKNLFGHGRMVNKYVGHIPWVFWYSAQYKKIYRQKIDNLYLHKDSKISSANNLFETVVDLGQVEFSTKRENRSIASDIFQEEKRYILQGLDPVDYDKSMMKSHINK